MLGYSQQVQDNLKHVEAAKKSSNKYCMPWEPKTFIFRGYNPYIGGVKPSNFMVLGSHGGCDST